MTRLPVVTGTIAALVLGLGACGSGSDPAPPATSSSTCRPASAQVALAAKGLEYDTACLAVPAGQPVTIAFDNQESVAHDVAITTTDGAIPPLFAGELFSGPGSRTYQVPPMTAGSYRFYCTIHAIQMRGRLVVE